MKANVTTALILAGGFGTRFDDEIKDYLRSHDEPRLRELVGNPKGFVKVEDRKVVDHLMDQLVQAGIDPERVYVHTHANHYSAFVEWAGTRGIPVVNVFNNGVTHPDDKLGTIGDLKAAVRSIGLGPDESLVFMAQDTLVYGRDGTPHDLTGMIRGHELDGASRIVVYECDPERRSRHGLAQFDASGLLTGFYEKPQNPDEFGLTHANASIHVYGPEFLRLLQEYEGDMDAHGHLLKKLQPSTPIRVEEVHSRLDIGGLADVLKVLRISHP